MHSGKDERFNKLRSTGVSARVEKGKIVVDASGLVSPVESIKEDPSSLLIQEVIVTEQEQSIVDKPEKDDSSSTQGREKMENTKNIYGTGLDVGTAFLVSARLNDSSEIMYKSYRDAFYTLKPVSKINAKFIQKGLDERGFDYAYDGDEFVITGAGAITMANERRESVRRPLSRGVISPKEKYALPMLKRIIANLVGTARVPGEKCVYSVPAKPVDSDFNITYHTTVINNFLLQELGFEPIPLNEAEAIVYAELMGEGLTGITLSFGAGMVNVCVASSGDPIIKFSVAHGGDFIDNEVARSVDVTPELAQAEKESPDFSLNAPSGSIQEAISIHYSDLITYILQQIEYEFKRLVDRREMPVFKNPLTVIVSGGTSKPQGFIDRFNECIAKVALPINIKEIRPASDPLTAVAKGCLFYALEGL